MIAGIVLAAGESKRMGQPKQLMRLGLTTMLNHVIDAAQTSRLDRIYVVLGHLADQVQASLRDPSRVTVVLNPDYQEGIGSSVRAGLAALPAGAEAAMFLLGDQPLLPRGLIDRLLRGATPSNIVAPCVRGERKNPTVFGRIFFPELLQVSGDAGGRSVLKAHPEAVELVELAGDYRDFDTPEDAQQLLRDLGWPEDEQS